MQIKKISIGGLKPTAITPVEGVISPTNNNTAKPNKVGDQSTVKMPKPKQLGQATDKPSQFYKSEQNQVIKNKNIKGLHDLLMKTRSKKGL